MRNVWVLALFVSLGSLAFSQRLYWGVVGGTGLTPDFPRYEDSAPADAYGNPASHFEHLPDSRSLILGGLLEVQITDRFSIEADILHRPLRDTIVFSTFPANGPATTSTNHYVAANTWEFPLMLKWTLPSLRVSRPIRPFVEGGIAFRTSQDIEAALPSQFGLTAGVGAAIHLGKLRVAPTIRYTRWDKETFFPPYPTKDDQVEFLTSVALETSSEPMHLNGHRLGLGFLGGLSALGEFDYPDSGLRERAGYFVGASVQLDLRRNLSLEADAIYKPLHDTDFTVLTWDFPVLVKYHVAKLGRAPFVEAGPSLRSSGNLNGYYPSHAGATVGLGAETQTRWARLSTALRYTRWLNDSPSGYSRTNANSLELLLGFGF